MQMKVYVVERFTDYEGSYLLKAFSDKKMALDFCLVEINKIHEKDYHKEAIVELPTGYRIGDEGVIYNELEVV